MKESKILPIIITVEHLTKNAQDYKGRDKFQ